MASVFCEKWKAFCVVGFYCTNQWICMEKRLHCSYCNYLWTWGLLEFEARVVDFSVCGWKRLLSASCYGQELLRGSIAYITAGLSLCLHGCLPSVSACVSEGEAVSNQSSLRAHSTTPGGITQRSARSGCDTGFSVNPRLRAHSE